MNKLYVNSDFPIREPKFKTDVGIDLYCSEDSFILPRTSSLIRTGTKIFSPLNVWHTVQLRSSFGIKRDLLCFQGIFDPQYTGEITVKIYNFDDDTIIIKKGERFAQLIFFKTVVPKIISCNDEEFEALELTSLRKTEGNNGL